MEDFIKDDERKFQALKYRHEDQSKLLQFLSTLDYKLYAGFLAVQLALGGFLTQNRISVIAKGGIFTIDVMIGVICISLLYRNFKYRQKIIETIWNCNFALGYEEEDVYIKGKKLNVHEIRNTKLPWFGLVAVGLSITILGIGFILLANQDEKTDGVKSPTSLIVSDSGKCCPSIYIENNPVFINNANSDTIIKKEKCNHKPCKTNF